MKKQLLSVIFILISLVSLYAQNKNTEDIEKLKKGNQIVIDARKAIGVEKEITNSFHFKWKTSIVTKIETPSGLSLGDIVTEVNASIPDKIQYIWSMQEPVPSKLTSIWNGAEYKKFSEFEMFGTRTVKEVTNSDSKNKRNLKILEGRISKEKLESLKKAGENDPKENVNNNLWAYFFPLILTHPFEQNIEFKYVGKAESSKNRIANVVDVKAKNGRTYRLLFDPETNYLLLMIVKFNIADGAFDGDYETKYYFSNRELTNSILIPKQIKVEQKFTAIGKEPRITYSNIDVVEFKLNPEFKKGMFDIN